MRDSEIIRRNFFKVRDDSVVLSKLVNILKQLPDGVLIANKDKPLYLNQKAKSILGEINSLGSNSLSSKMT